MFNGQRNSPGWWGGEGIEGPGDVERSETVLSRNKQQQNGHAASETLWLAFQL